MNALKLLAVTLVLPSISLAQPAPATPPAPTTSPSPAAQPAPTTPPAPTAPAPTARPAPTTPPAPASGDSAAEASAAAATPAVAAGALPPAGEASVVAGRPVSAASPPFEIAAEPDARLGFEASILPKGSLSAAAGGMSASADTNLAFAVGAVAQRPIDHTFTVEFAPRLVFNVKTDGDTESATELDVRARVTAGGYVAPNARLYAAFQPGYSFLFVPKGSSSDAPNPTGLTLGVGAGAAFLVAPKTWMNVEAGYQHGFQSATISGVDLELRTSFFHLSAGMLFDL